MTSARLGGLLGVLLWTGCIGPTGQGVFVNGDGDGDGDRGGDGDRTGDGDDPGDGDGDGDGACVGERCPPACPSGQTPCDAGRCVDLDSDPDHCGGCGQACASDDERCVGGVCVPPCTPGRVDCFGSCVDLTVDRFHCGVCGRGCPPQQLCIGGACACPPGLIDCGGGCVDPGNDPSHCGGCNVACALGSPCIEGGCADELCAPGQAPCDGGCVDLGGDPDHCGACGRACFDRPGAVAACEGGACTQRCLPGFAACDGNAQDGCETNLQVDDANCGACGNRCPNLDCSDGRCRGVDGCINLGWKYGDDPTWACPDGYRMPTIGEWARVEPCVTMDDEPRFDGNYHDVAVSVGGCNCKWNDNWCGQRSIETIRQGRACGDFEQLHVCVQL